MDETARSPLPLLRCSRGRLIVAALAPVQLVYVPTGHGFVLTGCCPKIWGPVCWSPEVVSSSPPLPLLLSLSSPLLLLLFCS